MNGLTKVNKELERLTEHYNSHKPTNNKEKINSNKETESNKEIDGKKKTFCSSFDIGKVRTYTQLNGMDGNKIANKMDEELDIIYNCAAWGKSIIGVRKIIKRCYDNPGGCPYNIAQQRINGNEKPNSKNIVALGIDDISDNVRDVGVGTASNGLLSKIISFF
ncbi:MAG: hypothetical protein KAU20_07760 [Nanoarchaeota archaeon]|nr:hypothetical protein [Nanoarchaeota archaeon]